ncbi:MAG: ABC transporter substrate-binding protein [Deltaproteobacteria bacterium]|nr:ABC transporter substrate-binding protein [Deltaproteobacteria bacterium]MBW2193227.1 ABC transporter substrate-binding protein [Deltaproteobacteria bacterium]
MKRILYTLLCLLLMTQIVAADETSDVEAMLKAKVDAVLTVVQNKTLEQQDKNKITAEIVEPMFDFPLMAKLALGKEHWSGISAEKQAEFTELFVKLLKDTYLEKLGTYTDETVTIRKASRVGKRIHVPTELVSKNNRIFTLYKLYKSKDEWKIYDLEVEGISLIKSYRTQFDSELSTGTIDDLLREMAAPKT